MDPESSMELLQRVKAGDGDALERLLTRYMAPLRRWAHGRLPRWARDLSDTQDLVQDAVLKTLRHLSAFEPAGPGALQAYLRQAIMNRLRDELRRVGRRPAPVELDEALESGATSPLAAAVGQQALERYNAALARLDEENRELIIARMECGYSYDEIAAIFEKPSGAAARVAIRRALLKVVGLMEPPNLTVKAG